MLAYDYPVMGAFWTMIWFFLWIMWIMLLFRVFADIFRSSDLSGWGKTGWLILTVFLPFLGVFIYVIARGHKMSEHALSDAKAQNEAMTAYVRQAAGSTGSADELAKLADLKEKGVITDAEFATQKAKILSA